MLFRSARKRGAPDVVFDKDEHPRPQATLESLAKLPAVFAKGGVVTAANASGMCVFLGLEIVWVLSNFLAIAATERRRTSS